MEPRIICVTGPDGAGKTTQLRRIAEGLEKRGGRKVAPVTIWDLLLDPATRGKIMFKSPGEVDGYLQILSPISRTLFLYHCFYQALELAKARRPDVLLVNAYWYKYYATEVAHGGDAPTLLRLAEIFPEPALVFYLQVDAEEAFRRKAVLSGYETGFANPRSKEAFLAFQARAHQALETEAERRGWIRMNGKEPAEPLTQMILARIGE
jgi:thymidylate kinase